MSAEWRGLKNEEKKQYEDMQNREKQRYLTQSAEYKKKLAL
jgi:hypothetical protein